MRRQADAIGANSAQPAAAMDAAVELGPTNPAEAINFTLSLVLPGQADMRAFLDGLYDPESPNYRHFLDAKEFGARFGLPLSEIEEVVTWLADNGLEVTFRPRQRTSLGVRGPAGEVNRVFGVTLVDHQTADGRPFHRPDRQPKVPAQMTGRVAHVVGLDNEPMVRPLFVPSPVYGFGVMHGGLRPEDVARAYEIDGLHAAGFNGEGQTVAIMSLGTFVPEDIAAFDQEMGISGPPVEAVRLEGADEQPNDYIGEVMLDIEIVRGIAPKAQILNYEGGDSLASFGPIISRITDDGRADIANLSYGWCERYYPEGLIESNEQEFAAAYLAGISVFVSSGDEGAYGCWRVRKNPNDMFDRDISPGVLSPASSPSVIAVGGTYLTVREDGTYYQEAGWEEPLGIGGAGGGVSAIYPRPAFQQGTGMDNSDSNGMRQVPDVGGPADAASGFIIIYTEDGEQQMATFGGTSAAAPFWAGSMVLVRQLANSRGIPSLGALAPVLYRVAAARPDVFHDVVRGGNLLHEAGAGWDYATGLGTPRVTPMADAIIAALR